MVHFRCSSISDRSWEKRTKVTFHQLLFERHAKLFVSLPQFVSLYLPLSRCTRWCTRHPPSTGCYSSLCLGLGKHGTTPKHTGYTHKHAKYKIHTFLFKKWESLNVTFSFSIATREMASPILWNWKDQKLRITHYQVQFSIIFKVFLCLNFFKQI